MSVYSFGTIRRGVTCVAVAATVAMSAGLAAAGDEQAPAQPAPAAQAAPAAQPAPPAAVNFPTAAGIMYHVIKADRAQDYEWLMGRLKDALAKSEDPVIKQQAAGFKVFKNVEPMKDSGNIMYVVLINPTVPSADYNMVTLLNMMYKAFPDQQAEMYKRFQGTFAGGSRVNLDLITDFSK